MSALLLNLRRFALVHSFLRAAVDALDDPVLGQIGARDPIGLEESGKPLPPTALVESMKQLNPLDQAKLVSCSCVASANLAHAYEHAFKLAKRLSTNERSVRQEQDTSRLDRLYGELPLSLRQKIDAIYDSSTSVEFEFEESMGASGLASEIDDAGSGSSAFQRQLNYWETHDLLRGSHAKYFDASIPFQTRIVIPLMSLEIVDRILSEVLSPRLNLEYTRITEDVVPQENPGIEWKESMFHVSLPDKRGRVIKARWKPAITSVVRIRPLGEEQWSVGFETPLHGCSFVGLEPDTEYEVQVTHKNEHGESEPALSKLRTERL